MFLTSLLQSLAVSTCTGGFNIRYCTPYYGPTVFSAMYELNIRLLRSPPPIRLHVAHRGTSTRVIWSHSKDAYCLYNKSSQSTARKLYLLVHYWGAFVLASLYIAAICSTGRLHGTLAQRRDRMGCCSAYVTLVVMATRNAQLPNSRRVNIDI